MSLLVVTWPSTCRDTHQRTCTVVRIDQSSEAGRLDTRDHVPMARSSLQRIERATSITKALTAASVVYAPQPLLPATAEAFRRPCVIASNHRSLFDVVAAYWIFDDLGIPVRPVSAARLWDKPGLRQFLDYVGAIPLKPGREALRTIAAAADALNAGYTLLVTPEGRLVPEAERIDGAGPGHKIVSKIAAAAGVPIIAAGMTGTDDFWPIDHTLPRIRPRRVTISVGFGPPREPIGSHRENVDLVMSDIRDILATLEAECHGASRESA